MSQDHISKTLKFWRAVETFNLPDIPAQRRSDQKIFTEFGPGGRRPWDDEERFAFVEGKEWRHVLFFGVVFKEAVVELLARLTGSEEFRDPVPGRTCLSALVVDQWGKPSNGGYFPAAFIYAIKILEEGMSPEELGDLLGKAREDYLYRFRLMRQQNEDADGLPGVVDDVLVQREMEYLQGADLL